MSEETTPSTNPASSETNNQPLSQGAPRGERHAGGQR
jgi:hypothetical protein